MKTVAVVISLQLYIYALTQIAFYADHGQQPYTGKTCLLLGAMYLSHSLAWLGNFTLLASWGAIFIKNQLPGIILSIVTLLLMFSFFSAKTVLIDEDSHHANIIGYGRGYYAWIGSAGVMLLGNIFFFVKNFSNGKKVLND